MKKPILSLIIFFSVAFSALAQDNWNSVLDRYEEICNICIELREMAGKGENVSYAKISSVLKEMNELRETLSGLQSSMTPEQKDRFIFIRDKYANKFGIPNNSPSPEIIADTIPVQNPEAITTSESITDDSVGQTIAVINEEGNGIETEITGLPFRFGLKAAIEISRNLQYGVSFTGRIGHWGGYVWASSNFIFPAADYSCTSDGKTSRGGVFWGDGTVKHSTYSISAGPSYLIGKNFDVFAGLGYWSKNTYWKDLSGEWAEVSDLTTKSVCIEAGCSLHIGHTESWKGALVISAGVRFIPSVRTVIPTAGLGYEF